MAKVKVSTVLVLEGDADAVDAALTFIVDMCQCVNVTVTESREGPEGID